MKASGKPPTALPAFVEPMLAVLTKPFESDEHLYEIKWDGFRSLCFVERDGHRLVGRRRTDFTARFPEFDVLAKLPPGSLIDGEIVHFTAGKPDFSSLLKRERSWSASAADSKRRRSIPQAPVTFVAFDLLYERHKSLIAKPLHERRRRLENLLADSHGPRLALSEGVVGNGLALFEHANRLGLEGVIAKRLDGPYEPGERSGSWAKFKQRHSVVCAIIGYQLGASNGVKSLILATDVDGEISFIGQVGSGISEHMNDRLLKEFQKREVPTPVVPCNIKPARWLRPELFCRVSFAEWTNAGKLRAPVFESLV